MMYKFGYGNYEMMGGGFSVLCVLTWLVVLIDLILVGIWLWQHIKKS